MVGLTQMDTSEMGGGRRGVGQNKLQKLIGIHNHFPSLFICRVPQTGWGLVSSQRNDGGGENRENCLLVPPCRIEASLAHGAVG